MIIGCRSLRYTLRAQTITSAWRVTVPEKVTSEWRAYRPWAPLVPSREVLQLKAAAAVAQQGARPLAGARRAGTGAGNRQGRRCIRYPHDREPADRRHVYRPLNCGTPRRRRTTVSPRGWGFRNPGVFFCFDSSRSSGGGFFLTEATEPMAGIVAMAVIAPQTAGAGRRLRA